MSNRHLIIFSSAEPRQIKQLLRHLTAAFPHVRLSVLQGEAGTVTPATDRAANNARSEFLLESRLHSSCLRRVGSEHPSRVDLATGPPPSLASRRTEVPEREIAKPR